MLEELSTRVDRNGLQSETSTKNVKGHVKVQDPEQGSRELTGLKKFTVQQGLFIGSLMISWAVDHSAIRCLCQLHPEIFDIITDDNVNDNSKTGYFGKSLVCLQVLSFIAQCISRLIRRLPISLLELNTLGHCICALLVYCFWWNKPLDVEKPILIQGENYRGNFAWMWMCSARVGGNWTAESNHVDFNRSSSVTQAIELAYEESAQDVPAIPPFDSSEESAVTPTTLQHGQLLFGTVISSVKKIPLSFPWSMFVAGDLLLLGSRTGAEFRAKDQCQ
ncbi:hypothetical protein WAI453_006914 [Rhynchosporium graminicola]